jgi:hypothetical protein
MIKFTSNSCLLNLEPADVDVISRKIHFDSKLVHDSLLDESARHTMFSSSMMASLLEDPGVSPRIRAYCAARLTMDRFFGCSGIISDKVAQIAIVFSKENEKASAAHPVGYVISMMKYAQGKYDRPQGVNYTSGNAVDEIYAHLIELSLFTCGCRPERLKSRKDAVWMHDNCIKMGKSIESRDHMAYNLSKYFQECSIALNMISQFMIV